jgi:hypothetical protein
VATDGVIRQVVPADALPVGPNSGVGGRTVGLRLAFSPVNGLLYVLEPDRHRILRLDGDHLTPVVRGEAVSSTLGGPVERAQLGAPYGLAFVRAGTLYVGVNKPPAVLMIGAALP